MGALCGINQTNVMPIWKIQIYVSFKCGMFMNLERGCEMKTVEPKNLPLGSQ